MRHALLAAVFAGQHMCRLDPFRIGFLAGSYGTWDDYLRLSSTRRGRQCIQPEVCRNFNFGAQV